MPILVGREHLFEECAQLDLAPGSAGFHVGKNLLEVANPDGQGLHLFKPFVDLLQAVVDLFKGFAEPCLEGTLELFVYRLTHLLQFHFIFGLNGRQPGIDSGLKILQFAFLQLRYSGQRR